MMDEDVLKLIDKNEVVIFGEGEKGEPNGAHTAQVQEIFDEHAPEYIMINVEDDRQSWIDTLSEFTEEWPSFPIVFIHGECVGGFDDIISLEEEGELEEMLGSK